MAGKFSTQGSGDVPPPVGSTGKPSTPPKNLYIGAINPRVLTEILLNQKVDWSDPESTNIMASTLETDYNELFDMKFNSPIYAGLKLGDNNMAVPAKRDEIKSMTTEDRLTPSLAAIKKIGDLKSVGVTDVDGTAVKQASLRGGKLNLIVDAPEELNKSMSNLSLTQKVLELTTPFQHKAKAGEKTVGYTPAGYTWRETGQMLCHATDYDDPVQGGVGDCWLIAALAAVAWADPYTITKRTRQVSQGNEQDQWLGIQFYSQPTWRNAPTMMIDLTDKTLVDNYGYAPYCNSSDAGENWPQVYEKAFAKWTTQDPSDEPDITTLSGGDPGYAIAQLTGKTCYYYDTWSHTSDELWGIVRENSVAFKTLNPMTAWTYGSGDQYNGSNVVANHAYTILGWAWNNGKMYIILRNPWGYVEPTGLNTYQGICMFFDSSFWHYIDMVGNDGVFALEASFFKLYYAYLAVAK